MRADRHRSAVIDRRATKKQAKTGEEAASSKIAAKARTRDSLQALSKLAELVDGEYRIVSQPPIVVPLRELGATVGMSADEIEQAVHEQFRAYRATLQDDRRHLLERFELVDVARKVVGVGSVGTRAFIVLLQGRDQQDPLFLQVKEATRVGARGPPAEEPLRPARRARRAGPAADAGRERHLPRLDEGRAGRTATCYWRQLRDMKGSAVVEDDGARGARRSTRASADRRLARAHARSGDPIAIAAYLGKKDRFDESITDFSERYADQNERDYEAFTEAIRSGRLQALEGV